MPKVSQKVKLQRAMAEVIDSAGYNAIARQVRKGKQVEKNVRLFLRMDKLQLSNNKKLYAETQKKMLRALNLWKKY